MIKYYAGRSKHVRLGTAIQVIEPYLEGNVVEKVRDLIEDDKRLLFIVDCDENQHQKNLERGDVESITKKEAVKLAAAYHPKRKYRKRTHWLSKARVVERPAFDLNKEVKRKQQKAQDNDAAG